MGVVACGYRNGDNDSDPRARWSGNSEGPIRRHPAPGSIHDLAGTTVSDGVDRRPQANFHAPRAIARSEWLVPWTITGGLL